MAPLDSYPHRSPTGRIMVAYVATDYGLDALHLGIALARGRDVSLEIVMVLPSGNSFSGVYPHDRGYTSILEDQIAAWLTEALALVPKEIPATARIVLGDSEAETLSSTAADLGCDLMVIGARKGGVFHRFRMGAAANALLHSAEVPIALAPKRYRYPGPITRLTAMFGVRKGNTDVIANGINRALKRHIPLRLVTLALAGEGGNTGGVGGTDPHRMIEQYANRVLADAARELVDAGLATTVIAPGASAEEAIVELGRTEGWEEGEIAIVGSSRMAVPGRLFIGATASRILRAIPVPMVVVPAGYEVPEKGPEKGPPGGDAADAGGGDDD